jgi:hypothetical protein
MDTNIQIREVQVSYQPLKGKLFQVRSADNAFEYLSRAHKKFLNFEGLKTVWNPPNFK